MIKKIIGGGFFPAYGGGEIGDWQRKIDGCAEGLKRKGVTHVMVNDAVASLLWALEPENSYLRFTTYGHTMDKYVSSTWNEGIYSGELLAANRKILLQQAAFARKYGFRCAMRCVEMTMMPETFFQRHPALRGPRVDNPACSRIPRFALCAMLPEVQDHYRQMTKKMMELVPDLDVITIFTNDSGAGFCYSTLYSGANGPVHCRDNPSYEQARVFCTVIGEAARETNPDFQVIMTSGMKPVEKALFIKGAPDCVASDVYGELAWGGGLEDQWINMEVGPAIYNDEALREKARDWAWRDYAARVAPIKANGSAFYASYAFEYYHCDLRPYEVYGIMQKLVSLEVEGLIGGAAGWTKYSPNTAAVRRVMDRGIEEIGAAVRAIAAEWVGEELADSLCEGWKLTDRAERDWPVPAHGGHAVRYNPLYRYMPLVPDEELLGERDLDYFMTPVIRDQQAMKSHQGGIWRTYYHTQTDLEAYLKQYETAVFPAYEKAIKIFDEGANKTDGDARDCFKEQSHVAGCHYASHMRLYYGLMASLHRIEQYRTPAGIPTFSEIVAKEIEINDHAIKNGWNASPPERIALMKKHINDPVKKVDFKDFPPQSHPGLNEAKNAETLLKGL
ncbi:MAG: hypothetical protein FWF03_04635 [Defluviitaleaceae bacterium]|nr:hypothetical protein [Defluviitaleaceae bacterium]